MPLSDREAIDRLKEEIVNQHWQLSIADQAILVGLEEAVIKGRILSIGQRKWIVQQRNYIRGFGNYTR